MRLLSSFKLYKSALAILPNRMKSNSASCFAKEIREAFHKKLNLSCLGNNPSAVRIVKAVLELLVRKVKRVNGSTP